ncbi:hypothetical protein Bbelb_424250 [Branchiostoma belcheri]|nr:hypothetical protein Bbelb_424250 [Branchiostoma belcheri]
MCKQGSLKAKQPQRREQSRTIVLELEPITTIDSPTRPFGRTLTPKALSTGSVVPAPAYPSRTDRAIQNRPTPRDVATSRVPPPCRRACVGVTRLSPSARHLKLGGDAVQPSARSTDPQLFLREDGQQPASVRGRGDPIHARGEEGAPARYYGTSAIAGIIPCTSLGTSGYFVVCEHALRQTGRRCDRSGRSLQELRAAILATRAKPDQNATWQAQRKLLIIRVKLAVAQMRRRLIAFKIFTMEHCRGAPRDLRPASRPAPLVVLTAAQSADTRTDLSRRTQPTTARPSPRVFSVVLGTVSRRDVSRFTVPRPLARSPAVILVRTDDFWTDSSRFEPIVRSDNKNSPIAAERRAKRLSHHTSAQSWSSAGCRLPSVLPTDPPSICWRHFPTQVYPCFHTITIPARHAGPLKTLLRHSSTVFVCPPLDPSCSGARRFSTKTQTRGGRLLETVDALHAADAPPKGDLKSPVNQRAAKGFSQLVKKVRPSRACGAGLGRVLGRKVSTRLTTRAEI